MFAKRKMYRSNVSKQRTCAGNALLLFTISVHWSGSSVHPLFKSCLPVFLLLLQSLKLWTQRTPLYLHHLQWWTLTMEAYCICPGRVLILCFLVSAECSMEQVDVILAKHESKHTQSCIQILLMMK